MPLNWLNKKESGDSMIDKSILATKKLNEIALETITKRVDTLNKSFFKDVELTEEEQKVLIWLCEWDADTVNNIVSAFKKAK